MKVCRTCANSDVNKSPMLKLFNKPKLLKNIEMFTGLVLTRRIGMPEYICDTCLQDVERAVRFRQRCIETQTKLSRKCDVNSVKIDKNTEDKTGDSVISFSLEEMSECQDELIDESSEIETQNELNCDYDVNSVRTGKKRADGTDDSVISFSIEGMSECQDEFIDNTTEYELVEEESFEVDTQNELSRNYDETTVEEESSEVNQEKFKKRIRKIDGPVVCEICGKSFNLVGNFREHQLRHSGTKRFSCRLCPYKFCTNKELVRHMRRHTGERPYACKYCDSRFADLSNRALHERRHRGERHFKCDLCDKSFVTLECLKKHKLTHTGVRSHCCTVCNQWFLRRSSLSAHLRSKGHIDNLSNKELNKISDDDEN